MIHCLRIGIKLMYFTLELKTINKECDRCFISGYHNPIAFYFPFIANNKKNQKTVSTAKRLASLFWYLIASTIDTLQNTINAWLWNCIYMELEVQYTCMFDPNSCWYYISKTDSFCFLLTLNCENLAKLLLPLAMF